MRVFMISIAAVLLQGCAAMSSMSPPVDKEAFDAKGKSVAVHYRFDNASACASNIVLVMDPCRGGDAEQRAGEFISVLNGYGFKAHRAAAGDTATPDYTIVVKEAVAKEENVKSLGFMMLSSFTMGLFPVISDARPANLSYELYKGKMDAQSKLHAHAASTHVQTLGGIYVLAMGPSNHSANQASLMTEHDRAVQNWVQGGLFE